MRVTDEQITALRAFLAFDPSYERLTSDLAGSGRMHGFGELVYAAFVTAVRRRFAPSWTSAHIVRFTARLRAGLRTQGVGLDPRATEILIRQALGDPVISDHDDHTLARVMLLVLGELISDEQPGAGSLDALIAEARVSADARLGARYR